MAKNNLLIISAHADDNIACAGSIFKLKESFGFVPYEIVLTGSELGQNFKSKKEVSEEINKEKRAEELSKASKYLGIERSFQFNQPDLDLTYSKDLVFKIVKIIRSVKPKIVFLHNQYERIQTTKKLLKLDLAQ